MKASDPAYRVNDMKMLETGEIVATPWQTLRWWAGAHSAWRPWTSEAFRCENCRWAYRLHASRARARRRAIGMDCCPRCYWSKHVMYGDWDGDPSFDPCDAMMRPVWADGKLRGHECLGCGFLHK